MGLFGYGPKDHTTKTERDAWKRNAQAQMDKQRGRDRDKKDTPKDDNPRHARRIAGLWA